MCAKGMRKKTKISVICLLVVPSLTLFGGTGRPADGLLFSLVFLGFLLVILGIIHLVEYIPVLIQKIIDILIGDISPSNGDLF